MPVLVSQRRLTAKLNRRVPALPIDLFRVLVGLLSFAYFLQIFREAADFTNPDGLIDHELVRQLFWYTRLSLFWPGMGLAVFQLIFLAACAGCVLLVVGYRPRLVAAFLYLVAASTYRWNFPVIYVDDSIMHLVLFWMILLPTGRTFTLAQWFCERGKALERWRREWVSGLAVRCFLINVSLVYIVAGMWKWTSPMWRDGAALYVALQMPISRAPDFWQPEYLPLLTVATYFTLLLEPLIPLMFILPTNHPLKWAFLLAAVGFHLGIIATMKIPYANVALIAVPLIAFRDEIMGAIGEGGGKRVEAPGEVRQVDPSGKVALVFVAVLTLAMAGEITVPTWRTPTRTERLAASGLASAGHGPAGSPDGRRGFLGTNHNPLYAPLWTVGIAQSYRLFDWVDYRNWDIRHQVFVSEPDGRRRAEDAKKLFPTSTHSILLQSYMHGITWGRVSSARAGELKLSIAARFAGRYCRRERTAGRVAVYDTVRRITLETSKHRHRVPEVFMQFECRASNGDLRYVRVLE